MSELRQFQKKALIICTILSLSFLSVAGCNSSEVTDDSSQNDSNTKTSESNETSEKAKSESSDITEGKIYDAVAEIAEVDYIKELEDNNKTSVYINIDTDTAEEFIQAAQSIVTLSPLKQYDNISVSTSLNDESASVVMVWDENEARYTSTCWDLTTDKLVEKAYEENELFSKIDVMSLFNENLDELYEQYGLTRN